jgi:putative ABC transport system ATP-binding protein
VRANVLSSRTDGGGRDGAVSPAMELCGAACTYASDELVVRALLPTRLAIWPGDHLAIMGPSGSGKSTLLNILGLLVRPTSGSVLVAGTDIAELDDAALSALRGAHIGFVFQAFYLLPYRTVYENVELPLRYARARVAERREAVMAGLEQVSLLGRAAALPGKLSGGERQRVAIARALVRRPRVLLCDEPTGNLDSGASEHILDALDVLNSAGITVVVVTHDEKVAARAGRLVLLKDGQASESRAL